MKLDVEFEPRKLVGTDYLRTLFSGMNPNFRKMIPTNFLYRPWAFVKFFLNNNQLLNSFCHDQDGAQHSQSLRSILSHMSAGGRIGSSKDLLTGRVASKIIFVFKGPRSSLTSPYAEGLRCEPSALGINVRSRSASMQVFTAQRTLLSS